MFLPRYKAEMSHRAHALWVTNAMMGQEEERPTALAVFVCVWWGGGGGAVAVSALEFVKP